MVATTTRRGDGQGQPNIAQPDNPHMCGLVRNLVNQRHWVPRKTSTHGIEAHKTCNCGNRTMKVSEDSVSRLQRLRHRPSRRRLRAVKGAFDVSSERISDILGKRVLLIDE